MLSAFTNDTVSYEYLILLNYRARASRGMKRFDLADVFTQRGWVVQDSIYTRESKSKAQEYASKFELKEKRVAVGQISRFVRTAYASVGRLVCPDGSAHHHPLDDFCEFAKNKDAEPYRSQTDR